MLVTPQPKASIGEMSCNPSIGGLAKGTLVREVDALDGLMVSKVHCELAIGDSPHALQEHGSSRTQAQGQITILSLQGKAADAAGIQFRMLNASKGPAVRGPRAQMDRKLYKQEMQQLLADVPGLDVYDGAVTNVLLSNSGSDVTYRAPAQSTIAGVMLASGKSNTTVLPHARV